MTERTRASTNGKAPWCVALVGLACAAPARADSGTTRPIPELQGTITIDADGGADGGCDTTDWPVAPAALAICLSNQPCASDPANTTGVVRFVIDHPDDPTEDQSLYVSFTVQDNTTENPGDSATLIFDLANGHVLGGDVPYDENPLRGVRFRRDGQAERIYDELMSPSNQGAIDPARVCWASDASGWTIEAQLRPEDIGRSDFKVFTAAALRVVNQNSGGFAIHSDWPTSNISNLSQWDHLLTRAPIDYVLVMDQSGSMFGDKWSSLKTAGNHLRQMLVQLNDATLQSAFTAAGVTGGGDRIGMAAFTTSFPDGAQVVPGRALGAIASAPSDYTGALPMNPGGGTPLAAGVNEAFSMFGGAANLGNSAHATTFPRQKVVVLLTDGIHNSPDTTLDFASGGDFDYVPVSPCNTSALHDSFVHVHPVALGTDATVKTSNLDEIKDCFSGKRFTGIYNISSATAGELTAQLTNFYLTTLLPYYQLNMLVDPSTFMPGMQFSVRAGERNLLLFAFWPDAASVPAAGLSVTDPASVVLSAVPGSANPAATCPAGTGYCYLSVPAPAPGAFTGLTAAGATGVYALLDLALEARFGIDNAPHGTSSTITLRARLQDKGQPLKGADVRVDAARPQLGFGTFASTSSLQGCKRGAPELPTVRIDGLDGKVPKLASVSPNLSVRSQPTAGDVKPQEFALVDALLKDCNQAELPRASDTALQLYDDGTHGDENAADGLYTLRFENTTIEGSYVFRFRAKGNDGAARPFERVQQISEYVRLDVDPASSASGSRVLGTAGNLVIEEFSVTPRDVHGGYLGPGHLTEVAFSVANADPLGGVRDYNNGIYAQIVRFDRSRGEPQVTPVVQGVPILPAGRCDQPCVAPHWLWLLAALVLVLALLLLLCWRRKA